MANRKKKLNEEKIAREKMLQIRIEKMQQEAANDKEEEDKMLETINKEIKKEYKRIMEDRAREKEK